MRRLLAAALGAAGAASLIALLYPRRGDGGIGSGSDGRGDYDYNYRTLHLGAWSFRLEWWPERETR